jgi:uncharacterized Zn finger protein (UPF0148 family)
MSEANPVVRNLHAAIAAAVEAGMAYTCPGSDYFDRKCEHCSLVVYEHDGTSYCGFYELQQTLKRMGPKTKRGDAQ